MIGQNNYLVIFVYSRTLQRCYGVVMFEMAGGEQLSVFGRSVHIGISVIQ